MEGLNKSIVQPRFCSYCNTPLDVKAHGNQKMHPGCSYEWKKQRQKELYGIGNSAKQSIQKNEKVAQRLHEMDKEKNGFPYIYALEQGLNFNCPVSKRDSVYGEVFMFDQYGYAFKDIKDETFIIFYYVSEIL